MRKFLDISRKEENENVDIASLGSMWDTEVTREGRDIHRDIGDEERADIEIGEKKEIKILKKKWKNFDALEKENFFQNLFRGDVVVAKKEPFLAFKSLPHRIYLYFQRHSRENFLFAWALIFLCLFVYFGLSKILIENRVNSWYSKLVEVREGSISLWEIQRNVNNSRFDLFVSDVLFTPFRILPGEKVDTAWNIISGGRYLSYALDNFLNLYDTFQDFTAEKPLSQIYFTQLFINIFPELEKIESSLRKSLENYESISWLPSDDLEEQRQWNIVKIKKILSYIEVLNSNFDNFLNILWHDRRKRYLIVFQNADEIRPTGGFMWSMALLEVFRWRVQLFQKKDVYAIEWDLKTANYERLDAPKWINELTEKFWLRDSNYYANLRDSSNGIKFFTDNAWMDIDGIVYINQNTLLRFLEITGPVYFGALDTYITHENFSEIMSLAVEWKIFKVGTLWTPKQVLFDFVEVFTQKLIDEGKYFDYLQAIIHDLESRDIMMWSFQEDENNFLSELAFNGGIDYDQTLDFAYPVYTSLSWNKSDRYISRSYNQIVKSWPSCSYDIELEILSRHTMQEQQIQEIESKMDLYWIESEEILQIQWAGRNRQFVRIILPSDSLIPQSDSYEIVNYGSRKGIEFFINTELFGESFYSFQYSLPNLECRDYDYMMYKQPWIRSFDISLDIDGANFNYPWREEDFYFELRN